LARQTRRSRRRQLLGAFVGLVLFGGAIYVLRSELQTHSLQEIIGELRALPTLRVVLALLATILGYAALAGYDAISLRALGHNLPAHRIGYAAFLAYAFANSLPLSVVTGSSVRYRLYSQWGLSASEAARVVTLNTVTYVVGLLASAGVAFAIQPVLLPGFLRLPLRSARPLGFVCLLLVVLYLGWSSKKDGPLHIFSWELPRPTLGRALAQIGVSGLDWVFSGAALYVLLPHVIPFHVFFAVFLLGQMASLVAQVPAGLGVFEAVVLWSLGPTHRAPAIIVALVGYRVIYFFLPLVLATLIWLVQEVWHWGKVAR
jgi:uncharacterized membrane protein YbhN (UPF0104 family)